MVVVAVLFVVLELLLTRVLFCRRAEILDLLRDTLDGIPATGRRHGDGAANN